MTKFETKLKDLRDDVRENLKEAFPEVNRLESLTELEDLKLTGIKDEEGVLILSYRASSRSYPAIRKLLLERGVAKNHNIVSGGRWGEFYRKHSQYSAHLGYYGSNLQIFLDVWPRSKNKKG